MTPFQKRLKSHVWGYKALEHHWFAKDGSPRAVRVPSTGEQITFRRALYGSFKGDIPENVDLRETCGAKGCLAPDHQGFFPTRTEARALHIPDLDGIGVDNRANKLPKGLTLALIARVKELARLGNSLGSICTVTRLSRSTVMKIRGGVFDRAIASVRRGVAIKKQARQRVEVVADPSRLAVEPTTDDVSDYPEVPDEEVEAWLRSIQ